MNDEFIKDYAEESYEEGDEFEKKFNEKIDVFH
jgi:hypothetical protein